MEGKRMKEHIEIVESIRGLWNWHIRNDKFYVSLNGVCHIEAMVEIAERDEEVENWWELSDDTLLEFLAYLEESKQEVKKQNLTYYGSEKFK